MSYEVLARKWRPQQFQDVVGQDHVTQTLRNAIRSKRLAHAYLFVGPRGTGKTSLARIFAKSLNCEKGPTADPCDACDACREITTGNSLDVLEIDGASNNSVDQVRDLRETVKYLPVRGPFKIFVIDEVHMLSASAFNALLKTLEEPPPHVKFVFATTEPDKILATIVSRCQRFDLRRIPVPLIIERLRLVAKDEKVAIDEDALLAIARGAEGGLRDAESSLDQLISFKGRKIVEEDVLSVFGLVSRGMLETLAGSILEGDMRGLVRAVGDLDAAGKDVQRLMVELMQYFRNVLVCLHAGESTEGLDLPDFQIAELRKQGAKTHTGRVIRILEILSETLAQMKYALSKRTLLETSLIRCARAATVVTLEEILDKLNALRGTLSPAASRPELPQEAPGRREEPARVEAPAEGPEEPDPASVDAAEDPADQAPGDELDRLRQGWGDIVERAAKIAPLAKASLVDSSPVAVARGNVVIGCDPGFGEDVRSLGHARNRAVVERVISDYLRRKVTVEFVEAADPSPSPAATTNSGDDAAEDSDDAPGGEPAGGEAPNEAVPRRETAKRPLREWANEPAVRESLDLFDGYIAEVRE